MILWGPEIEGDIYRYIKNLKKIFVIYNNKSHRVIESSIRGVEES